jgi:hypothetical protein
MFFDGLPKKGLKVGEKWIQKMARYPQYQGCVRVVRLGGGGFWG